MTSSPFRVPVRWTLLLAALAPLPASAAVWEFNIVGDMYADGRKVSHPTPDKPVYYYPYVHDFSDIGPGSTGDPVPPKKDLIHDIAAALASQGYLATREVEIPPAANSVRARGQALVGPPSLVLVFDWGSLHPQALDGSLGGDATTSTAPPTVLNKDQMIGLTAGKDFDGIAGFNLKTEDILQGLQYDRYFVVVSAYDFDAYFQHHKKVLLWVAKMSVRSEGTTMAGVMPSLIRAGAPLLGRETTGPKLVDVPTVPEGKVEVGTPTVVGH